jgi:hypothetical protein
MAIQALPAPKVLTTGYKVIDPLLAFFGKMYWVLIQVPVHGLKVYPPVLFIAATAAYASSKFAEHASVFPSPLSWLLAIAFEWVYIGALAMASVTRGIWFYIVLATGALTSVTFIMLHAADKYGILGMILDLAPVEWHTAIRLAVNILLVLAHSVPLTLVNVVYGFLIHQHNAELNSRIYCEYGCGAFFTTEPAARGHKAQCSKKPKA